MVIKYALKLLQLSCFGMYLIPNKEKKAKSLSEV
jgi:hypothetical protein